MTVRRASIWLIGVFAASALLAQPAAGRAEGQGGEILEVAEAVAGEYIVVLDDVSASEVRTTAAELAEEHDGDVLHTYRSALRGFAVEMSEADALALSQEPDVAYVEENGVARASATQSNPPWGLDRIDQGDPPLDNTYTYDNTGSGVRAYVLDTGIRRTHSQFGGRATAGFDAIGDGRNTNDCNGHGTHVAGTIGSSTYGVAKAVSLIAVRVLDCEGNGTYAQIIAGIDWVTANAVRPAVANMSLGGPASTATDNAVTNSIASGIVYAIAAGNDDVNACNVTPARTPNAITVGSTTSADRRSSFSNWGSCLDIFGPGSDIPSTWHTSDTATNTISGTSMATPHVAGVVARHLQANPTATPAAVAGALTGNSLAGRVIDPRTGSPNRLLYSRFIDGVPPPSVPQPPANDNFANAQALSNGSVAGTNLRATIETGEPSHAGHKQSSVWYRWTAPSAGPVTVHTCTSSFDTVLAAYTGGSVGGLTGVTSNDDGGCSPNTFGSRIQFTAVSGTTYRFAVDGYDGDAGTFSLTASLPGAPAAPVVSGLSPSSGSSAGGNQVSVSGTGFTGASSVSFGSTAVSSFSVQSATQILATAPAGTGSVNVRVTTAGGTSAVGAGNEYTYVAPAAPVVSGLSPSSGSSAGGNQVSVSGTGFTGASSVSFGSTAVSSFSVQSATQILATAPAGTGSVNVRVTTAGGTSAVGAGNEYTYVATPPPPSNDAFGRARALTGGSFDVTGTNRSATKQAREPNHAGNRGGASVWFRWTAPNTRYYTIRTVGSTFDTTLAVYRGATLAGLTQVAANDDAPGAGFQSRVRFRAVRGVTYRIAVDGYARTSTPAATGSIRLRSAPS